MKPVLILKFPYSSQPHLGGGELHTLTLCDEFVAQGTSFYFVGSCAMLLKQFRERRWPALRWWAGKEPVAMWSAALFPFTSIIALPALILLVAYYRIFRGVRNVYCLSLTEKLLITPWARLFGMHVVWAEHVSSTRRWLRLNPFRPFYVLWSRMVTVMVISKDVQNTFTALGVSEKNIRVIYNGVDMTPFAGFHRNSAHWTQQFVIGSIGRQEPEKGYVYLLRAFQTVLSFVPQARLILAGDGSEHAQLEWVARQLGVDRSVQFVGFQSDIAAWYKTFDCFVLPSVEREAFGIVLLEAFAASCPVIGSNLGGIPEIIQDNLNGHLVAPRDVEGLAQAILWVYQHPDVALEEARAGHEMVTEKFTMETTRSSLMLLFV